MNTHKNFINEKRIEIFAGQKSLPGMTKTALFSAEIDKILASAYSARLEESEIDKHVCLIALGGYGRGELCPFSDIDLLILHSGSANKDKIAAAVRFFWDLGLSLGLVVRSLHECDKILGEDIASDTALLQVRFLAGNKRLFHHLENAVIKPYFSKNKKQFANTMRLTVHNGIFSQDNTLFRTEPNVKDGICALRDCQRIVWAERVIAGAKTISDLYHISHYKQSEIDSFTAAYEFLISLRIELHMICNKRLDILETALQADVAEALGFGKNNPAPLMEAYFRTVRNVRDFAMTFLEKRLPGRGLWTSLRSSVGAIKIKTGLYLLDGIFFLSQKQYPEPVSTPVWILDIFKQAAIYKATLSVELSNWIRSVIQEKTSQDFRSQEIDALFLDILSLEKGAGRVLSFMHDTGVLSALIPAFGPLTCKVEYDTNHEYTVDQHILLSLRALDELDSDQDQVIRTLFLQLTQKRLLRLAVLLHDIGKAMDGDHVLNGTIIAEEICDRLGLEKEEKQRVTFLIYNHLALSSLAFGRELEDHLVKEFAQSIGSKETLDILYLLTVLDIRNVGYKTWTAWRARLLETAYDRILAFLSHDAPSLTPVTPDDSFISIESLAEDREKQNAWLAELKPGEFKLELEKFIGFDRLSILSFDRIGLFADITGCISSEGYSILSAKAYSMSTGGVLDIFHVESDGVTGISSEARAENIRKKWKLVSTGESSTDKLIEERLKMYPQKKARTIQRSPSVQINNEISKLYSVLEIEAQDRFGLLYTIARSLSNHNVNIVSARLSTRIDRALDSFYITNKDGNKIESPSSIADLTSAIISSIDNQ